MTRQDRMITLRLKVHKAIMDYEMETHPSLTEEQASVDAYEMVCGKTERQLDKLYDFHS